jgi:hypothetical protein
MRLAINRLRRPAPRFLLDSARENGPIIYL